MRAALPLLLSAALLAGCATPTPYAAASRPGAPGWSERQVEGDRWQVAFTGAGGAGPRRTLDLALLRAAEVTLAQGGRWITLDGRQGVATDPHWGGVGRLFGETVGYATTLDFRIGRGDVPPNVTSLDARQTAEALRADIARQRDPALPRFVWARAAGPRA